MHLHHKRPLSTIGALNSGQKMALRACYFIRSLTKAPTFYYINRSQRHLLVAIENKLLEGPIDLIKDPKNEFELFSDL